MSENPLYDLAMKVVADYNRGDLEAWSSNYSTNYIHHNPYQPDVHNVQTYKQFQTSLQAAFPGLTLVSDDIVTQGMLASGSVAIRYHLQGTGKGTWRGAEITGKTVNFTCVLFIKVADGKLVEGWEVDDYLAYYKQMGLIPAPASAATPA
jgi:predicted ester cyclase